MVFVRVEDSELLCGGISKLREGFVGLNASLGLTARVEVSGGGDSSKV